MKRIPALLLPLAALALCPGAARPAAWALVDDRVSNSPALALTAPSGRSIGRLPDGTLYAVWYERRAQNVSDIKGARRPPDGSWTVEPVISGDDSLSRNPSLAVTDDGAVHVVWEDRRDNNMEIYYRRRAPDGTWDPEERLTSNLALSLTPVLATGTGGRIHLVWSDGSTGDTEIHYRHRDPDGVWSIDVTLTRDPGPSQNPAVAVDVADRVHVVWQDIVLDPLPGENDPGNLEVYHLVLDRDGTPVTARNRVSRAANTSHQPSLAAGPDGAVHVFWSDSRDRAPNNSNRYPFAIWYRRWLPDLGFGHEKRFCYSNTDHLHPVAACGPDGTVNVVWEDFAEGNSELFFRQISPQTGWDVEQTRLTETLGATNGPGLISDAEGTLHLLWSDTGPGEQPSIRYRSGSVDSRTPVRLQGLNLHWRDGDLELAWRTAFEENHLGFQVHGAADPDEESRPVVPGLVTGGPAYAVRIDRALLAGAAWLRLVAVARDGGRSTAALIPVPPEAGSGAGLARLLPPSPNPSRGSVDLAFDAGLPGRATMDIVDVQGRRVARLDLGIVPAGHTRVAWSGRRDDGGLAAPGRYWGRLALDGRSAARPVSIAIVR